MATTATDSTTSASTFPVDVPLGGGDVRLPDRGRGRCRRARPQHLGPFLREAGQRAQRRERRAGLRLLPPLPGGHRARARARRQRAPALDLVAARPAGGSRAREQRRARLLRPRRRRAARQRDRAARDALSLGSAGRARGRRRLARARHRRGLRRVRADRRRAPGRPGPALDHAQRAVGDRLARLRLRRPCARTDLRGRRGRRRPPRPAGPRSRHRGSPTRVGHCAHRRLGRPRDRAGRDRVPRRRRGCAGLRRTPEPLVPRPALPGHVPGGRPRAARRERAAGPGR